jgi:hypothetical protein
MYRVAVMNDDVVYRDVCSAVLQLRRIRKEADRLSAWANSECCHLWQALVKALHPQSLEGDLSQIRAEGSSRRGIKLDIRGSNRLLAAKWIVEMQNSGP